VAQLAEALAGCHRAEVVHRDVKLGIILLDLDDSTSEEVVVDEERGENRWISRRERERDGGGDWRRRK